MENFKIFATSYEIKRSKGSNRNNNSNQSILNSVKTPSYQITPKCPKRCEQRELKLIQKTIALQHHGYPNKFTIRCTTSGMRYNKIQICYLLNHTPN